MPLAGRPCNYLGCGRISRLLAGWSFVTPGQEDLRKTFVWRWVRNDKQAYLWSVDAIMQWSVADRLKNIDVPTLLVSSAFHEVVDAFLTRLGQ